MPSRTVRFFEILDEDGKQMPDLDWTGLLAAVRALPAKDAYLHVARMELLGSCYEPNGKGVRACDMLILDRITRDVRIRIENNRNYRPLQLGKDDTLAEPTHYGLFPRNVVGVLRAGTHTPGPASLRDFLNAGGFFEDPITIKALADINALRALSDVDQLTSMEIEMDAAAAGQVLGQNSMLGNVFDNFRTRLGGVTIDVIVKIDRGLHEASDTALGELREIVEDDDARQVVTKAKMKYKRLEDGRVDTFDFINESVAKSVEVDIDEEGSGPTDLSASQGIAAAYEALYDDIASALAGRT
ncbi:DUF6731 family protein [Terrabacter sp. 2TAF16]|uniref:hypothetical protein n=1 Tax=Terrabacter sp. 2TAF16 TaxID=3233008 RepID=UPI003F9C8EE8